MAAGRALPRRHAAARQPVPRAHGREGAARPELRRRPRRRRPQAASARSTTCWSGSSRPRASRSIRGSGPSSSSTRAPGTGPASAASRPTARSASRCAAGHPCYFVGFLPNPVPGPDDRGRHARRGRASSSEVAELHPEAEGKPVVIGNCQAGWQIMMMAAIRPELVRPDHRSPARRSPTGPACAARTRCATRAALLGGSWLTALAGDLGNGIFDGACAGRRTSRALNPANTLWSKQYNLYSKIDTEARALPRLREVVGRPRPAQRRGDAVDRRQPVRRQQAGHGRARSPRTGRGSTCATSRSPIVVLLLLGRRHHAAAAGAGLDHRPLRQRRRHPRPRPDHRLLRPRERRPSRHLRLRRGGEEGARRSSPPTSTSSTSCRPASTRP